MEVGGTFVTGSSLGVAVGGTDSSFESCSTGGSFVVEAGSHDIDLIVTNVAADTFLWSGFLTVLWVPFYDTP